jgi:uncharacterized membrane protein
MDASVGMAHGPPEMGWAELLRIIHVTAGFAALALLWFPLLSSKGARLHRRTGVAYVVAMAVVAATALPLGAARALDAELAPRSRLFGVFLIFIALFTANALTFGLRALRLQTRTGPHRHPLDLGSPALLLALAAGTIGLGARAGFPLLMIFPWIAVFLSISQLRYWLTTPGPRLHGQREHMGAMFAASIATLTAFTTFGAPRLLGLSGTHLALWLAPTAVMVPWLVLWQRRLARRET